jgi:hypothetical protein
MRAGWWEWNEEWIAGRGISPDDWYSDFEVHDGTGAPPPYEGDPWAWSGWALTESNVVGGQGIWLPWRSAEIPVFDLTLGNRQLYPWKLWYVELRFVPHPRYKEEFEYNIAQLQDGGMTVEWYGKKEVGEPGAREWITLGEAPDTVAQEVRSGWERTKDNVPIWYAEYYFEPQVDFENIIWTFDTTRFVPESSLYVRRVYGGTTCSPEPVTMALLALGLPMGLLACRRRKE